MNVNLKSLVGRLNDTSRNALEGAAGLCLSRTNYDVEVEHILAKLLEQDDTTSTRSPPITKSILIASPRCQYGTRAAEKWNSRTPGLSDRIPR